MKLFITLLAFIFILPNCSCKESKHQGTEIPRGWIKHNLPNNWVVYTPQDFVDTALQGIDSDPGLLYSKKDSIYLEYDSGEEMFNSKRCDFKNSYNKAKSDIDTGFYKRRYDIPILHNAIIDTINDNVAVIIRPVISGEGIMRLGFSDCKSGAWISVEGKNIFYPKEELILQIFRTIRHEVK